MIPKKWALLIIIGLFLNLVNAFVPIVEADDPPEPYLYWNAPPGTNFGIQSIKEVNWSFFKQLFLSHIDWSLEYNLGAGWQPGNQYLTINRTWFNESGNTSGFWKFTLIFDNPVAGVDARFTFACDLSVLSYVHKVSAYTYFINYTVPGTNETYHCLFNFSDMINIPNIIFTHGIQNNMFWFRFRRDNIPAGTFIFDPTFGETGTGTTTQTYIGDIWGSPASPATDGTASKITIYCKTTSPELLRCAIYDDSDNSFVAQTEEKLVTTGGVFAWVDFNFSVAVDNGITYIISTWGADESFRVDSAGTTLYRYKTSYTGDFSAVDPLPISATLSATLCAYVTYTEAPANFCNISYENPVNNSVDIELSITWNVTIENPYGTNFEWWIINLNSSDHEFDISDSNGSKECDMFNLDLDFLYYVYVITLNEDGYHNETFFFTTVSFGAGAFDWEMVSMPVNFSVPKWDVRILIDGYNYSWNESTSNSNHFSEPIILTLVYGWDIDGQNYVYNDTFEPYKGYWVYWFHVGNLSSSNATAPGGNVTFDGNDSEIWLYTGDVIEFDTTQFNFIVLVILIAFFTALGETADCKNPKIKQREYFRRALSFLMVTILCIYGGVANAQTFAWYFSFVFLIMAGFYGFRCFINFGNMKKSEVT